MRGRPRGACRTPAPGKVVGPCRPPQAHPLRGAGEHAGAGPPAAARRATCRGAIGSCRNTAPRHALGGRAAAVAAVQRDSGAAWPRSPSGERFAANSPVCHSDACHARPPGRPATVRTHPAPQRDRAAGYRRAQRDPVRRAGGLPAGQPAGRRRRAARDVADGGARPAHRGERERDARLRADRRPPLPRHLRRGDAALRRGTGGPAQARGRRGKPPAPAARADPARAVAEVRAGDAGPAPRGRRRGRDAAAGGGRGQALDRRDPGRVRRHHAGRAPAAAGAHRPRRHHQRGAHRAVRGGAAGTQGHAGLLRPARPDGVVGPLRGRAAAAGRAHGLPAGAGLAARRPEPARAGAGRPQRPAGRRPQVARLPGRLSRQRRGCGVRARGRRPGAAHRQLRTGRRPGRAEGAARAGREPGRRSRGQRPADAAGAGPGAIPADQQRRRRRAAGGGADHAQRP